MNTNPAKPATQETKEKATEAQNKPPFADNAKTPTQSRADVTDSQTAGPLGCEKQLRLVRVCLAINGDSLAVCEAYLSEWKQCKKVSNNTPKNAVD